MNLNQNEYIQLAEEARRIGGYVSALRSLGSTKLSVERIREISNDVYTSVDNFLLLVEKLENKAKRREKKSAV